MTELAEPLPPKTRKKQIGNSPQGLNPLAWHAFRIGAGAAALGLLLDVFRDAPFEQNEPFWPASWLFYPGVLTATLAYLFLFFYEERDRAASKASDRRWHTALAVSLLAGGAFAAYHAGLERYVAFWDSAGYWKYCMYYLEHFWNSPLHGAGAVYLSILEEEYNKLPTMLIGPGLQVLGVAFPGYVLAIYALFLAPAAVQCAWILRSLGRDLVPGHMRFVDVASALVFLLLPIVWVPMCNGMLDAVGLPFAFALLVAIRQRAFQTWPLWKLAMLVPVVVVLAFTRRWYGIWIGGYFGALALTELVFLFQPGPDRWRRFLRTGLLALGLVAAAVVLWAALFPDFLKRSLFNDYSDIYKAYQFGGLGYDLASIVSHVSWLWVALCASGLAMGYMNPATRHFAVFTALHLVLATAIHLRINNFSWHHFYLLAGQMAVLGFMALAGLRQLKGSKPLVYIALALMAGNWVQVLAPDPPGFLRAFGDLNSASRVPPRQRADLKALYALDLRLREICSPLGLKAYAVGSSFTFNDDILRCLGLPEVQEAAPYLAGRHAHVDRRDPFPPGFVTADVIALALPVQYHLAPEDQRIVGYLAEALTDSAGIGHHYRQEASFQLEGGVTVHILRKTGPWLPQEAEALARRFREAYPQYPAMAEVSALEARTFERHQPADYGQALWQDGGQTLVLHPGKELPAGLSLALTGPEQTLAFRPVFSEPCGGESEADLQIWADSAQVYDAYLQAGQEPPLVRVPVAGARTVRFRITHGRQGDACDKVLLKDLRFE